MILVFDKYSLETIWVLEILGLNRIRLLNESDDIYLGLSPNTYSFKFYNEEKLKYLTLRGERNFSYFYGQIYGGLWIPIGIKRLGWGK